MALVDMLLPEFDHEMATTRRLLERVPDDRLSWTPHAKSFTLGQLAQHVATIPMWGTMTLTSNELDLAGGFTNPPVMNHLVHHRAQLSVYLRMQDVPLPAMYGPTADEQAF